MRGQIPKQGTTPVFVHTVCISREGTDFVDSSSRMWHISFLELADAKEAVLKDWAAMVEGDDTEPPRWAHEQTEGPCYVFNDYDNSGYCWTVMTTELAKRSGNP